MQEDFLHYIWKHKKVQLTNLKTTRGENITINAVGQYNQNSGPDFFNAQVRIANQLWAGNVEIHVKSSDWFLHNHETDQAYDNVILHVVWEHDIDVFRKDNSVIPTLELSHIVNQDILGTYNKLFINNSKWINCEDSFARVDDFVVDNWLERLYVERLERKSSTIENILKTTKNDWEAVLFQMLCKNFGLKVNGEAFFSLGQSFRFSIVRKTRSNIMQLEALLFGQAGLLEGDFENAYFENLKKDYAFLKQKFHIENSTVLPIHFFRLRPSNFPTIRLSQLTNLYHLQDNLFSKVIEAKNIDDIYKLFKVNTSKFWEAHYTFQKSSKPTVKSLSKSFIDLLVINTIIPIKFWYAMKQGELAETSIFNLAKSMPSEKNNIIKAFNELKQIAHSSFESQALIQLKTVYCAKHKCLECAIGNQLLSE
ncbi:DUF2851 family protein [Tamlana fucoidanivorans]|uniref:DUF2851 family protein n=1 Tax=Allotamlana fucoidanivorans TaxID=2583814 RepID=A0A5C4SJN5_9FLAO|nr:DUF2851 family protein [Tamlana fucoidanivorans]TNJ43567.1 DUF2851 family protein [Tamlana fucoidanivorans]